MFGSQILDVAIGLVFTYLLVSLIVSVINEWIARHLSLRASTLEDALRNMLQQPKSAAQGDASSLVDKLYNHPLIQGLSPLRSRGKRILRILQFKTQPVGTKTSGLREIQEGVAPPPDDWEARRAALSRSTPLGEPATCTGRPSYIDPRNFSLALLDIVAPNGTRSKNIEEVKREISLIQNPRLKLTLLTLVNTGEAELQSARARIEAWFNDGMERVSGWYRRKVQLIILGLGLGLAIFLNVDTLHIARTLWTQPLVRDALARSADRFGQQNPQDDRDAQRRQIDTYMSELSATNLPIGWSLETDQPAQHDPRRVLDILADKSMIPSKLLGLLLTGVAVSLGAPFWFDTLSRLTNVRSTGNPPSTYDDTAKASA